MLVNASSVDAGGVQHRSVITGQPQHYLDQGHGDHDLELHASVSPQLATNPRCRIAAHPLVDQWTREV